MGQTLENPSKPGAAALGRRLLCCAWGGAETGTLAQGHRQGVKAAVGPSCGPAGRGEPGVPVSRPDPLSVAVMGEPFHLREPWGSHHLLLFAFVSFREGLILDKCRKAVTRDHSSSTLGAEDTVLGPDPTGRFQ